MGCGVYWQQVRELERAMGTMRKFGIPEVSDAYQTLLGARGRLMRQVGLKFPRGIMQIVKLVGLSPGIITLWEDIESGWLVEARVKAGAPPIYHYVGDEVAMAIARKELTKEQEAVLMTPDPYLGE